MSHVVRLKDGSYGTVIREWSWQDNPYLKVYKDTTHKERLYEDFVDVELDAHFKGKNLKGANPLHSNFYQVFSTVCQKDVEYVYLTKE